MDISLDSNCSCALALVPVLSISAHVISVLLDTPEVKFMIKEVEPHGTTPDAESDLEQNIDLISAKRRWQV